MLGGSLLFVVATSVSHQERTSGNFVQSTSTPLLDTASSTTSVRPLKPPRQAPVGELEYRDTAYRFALFYSYSLQVNQYNEGGGARTVVFQNPAGAQGFQVYITPYAQDVVDTTQFKKDEPSGVQLAPKAVSIDGAKGTSFYCKEASLGDTAEIWFIHDGYLYEVSTFKAGAPLLNDVMQSWEFL